MLRFSQCPVGVVLSDCRRVQVSKILDDIRMSSIAKEMEGCTYYRNVRPYRLHSKHVVLSGEVTQSRS